MLSILICLQILMTMFTELEEQVAQVKYWEASLLICTGKAGVSTSFVSEKDMGVISKLLDLLYDNNQEPPSWLVTMGQAAKYNRDMVSTESYIKYRFQMINGFFAV